MALPKVNATPNYTMEVPSTGQKVSFRPYLVKEEKILLMAFESQETRGILRAMLDVISNCVEEQIDLTALATFDVEYMFLKIRSKSVGEKSNIVAICQAEGCEEQNSIEVDLDKINLEKPEVDSIIKLTEDVWVEMHWPSYNDMIESNITEEEHQVNTTDLMNMVITGIGAICTNEERIETKDVPKEELEAFIDQLTSDQFKKIQEFFNGMPSLKYMAEYKCTKCGHDNVKELSGMADFF